MIPRYRYGAVLLACAGIAFLTAGCGGGRTPQGGPPGSPDTTRTTAAPVPAPPDTSVHAGAYGVTPIADQKALRRLYLSLGAERFLLALKVNRRDSLHVRTGDSLMLPDSNATLLALSPFPRQVPSTSDLD